VGDWLLNLIDLKIHGPIGAAVVGIVYYGTRHIKSNAKEFRAVDERCKALETDRVVKADWVRLDDKLDAITLQNAETLRMLAGWKR
jgi:hypothetical protein